MTCFWSGVRASLQSADFRVLGVGGGGAERSPSLHELVKALQKCNQATRQVLVNGQFLTEAEIEEGLLWVARYDVGRIASGHWCSTRDPFLTLLCQVLEVCIEHVYCGKRQTYVHTRFVGVPDAEVPWLKFSSSASHFSHHH